MPNPSNSDLVGEVWVREEGVTCVVCPACAFTFNAAHENQRDGGYLCPCCAEDRLAQQLEQAEQLPDKWAIDVRAAHDAGSAHPSNSPDAEYHRGRAHGIVQALNDLRAALTPDEGADPPEEEG